MKYRRRDDFCDLPQQDPEALVKAAEEVAKVRSAVVMDLLVLHTKIADPDLMKCCRYEIGIIKYDGESCYKLIY